VDPARVAAMICPIGIGGIRSKLPAAIAVSAVAQIITLHEALQASEDAAPQSLRTTG
jgi:xanthine dehydrogenase accessory factor